ncbi:hypothetical protein INR49_016254, partial [Caranx melampygus]
PYGPWLSSVEAGGVDSGSRQDRSGSLVCSRCSRCSVRRHDTCPPHMIYAVTVSSRLTGGKQETLCAHIHGPTEPVSLQVVMEINSANTVLLTEAVKQDFYRCVNFQVPVVLSRTVANIKVTVQGENAAMTKVSKVAIEPPVFIHIMQTDKPIYKPGQTVQFRIVSMDTNFIPVARVYKMVELQDPNSNRIAQWLDKSIDVLPKYEVKVHLPSVISILDKEATMKICGKYTYGKPVIGSVKAEFCRNSARFYWYNPQDMICKTYQLTTDKSGCATQIVNVTEFSPDKTMYDDNVDVTAEIEEFGTGVVLKGSGQTSFSSSIRVVTFEDVPAAYKPGIPFEGKVKVVGLGNKPVADEPVYLFVGDVHNATLKTDKSGMASFSLDTSLWKSSELLRANTKKTEDFEPLEPSVRRPSYRSAHHHVTAFYSKSSSFLKIMQVGELSCDKDATVRAQYIITGEELKAGQEVLDFFYLVMSRGAIVQHGRIPVAVKAGTVNKGELSVTLQQVMSLAPFAQVAVYTVMPSGEAVADSQDFPIQLCLNNKVSLKFSSIQSLPAEKTTLSLQARPRSICSVRAIDQSVLLLQAGPEISIKQVYQDLPVQRLMGYSYDVEDSEPYPCYPELVPVPVVEPEPEPEPELELDVVVDAQSDQQETTHYTVNLEYDEEPIAYALMEEVQDLLPGEPDPPPKPVSKPKAETIRSFFLRPGSGSWFLLDLVDSPVPMAFNMMPLSAGVVLKGKDEEKKETVRTFFPETWIWDLVKVTLADSDSFTFRDCDGCQYSVCLCGEESRTFSWIVTPTALGRGNSSDGQSQRLLCPADGPVEKKISLLLPEMFVAGSARASVSVLAYITAAMLELDGNATISTHYNVPPPDDFSAFNMSTHVMAKCNISRPQLIVFVHVRYQGRRGKPTW